MMGLLSQVTGEPCDTETVKHGLVGGGWKSAYLGNSLAAYPTSCPVRREGWEKPLRAICVWRSRPYSTGSNPQPRGCSYHAAGSRGGQAVGHRCAGPPGDRWGTLCFAKRARFGVYAVNLTEKRLNSPVAGCHSVSRAETMVEAGPRLRAMANLSSFD
jgi:hypothetical protein